MIVIIVIALCVRVGLALLNHVAGDACWHLAIAKQLGKTHDFLSLTNIGRDQPFYAPPLFHIVGAIVFAVCSTLGESVGSVSILLVNPIIGTLTIIFSFILVRKLFNERIALFSAAFMAIIPFHLTFSYTGYVEMLLFLLSILAIYFASRNQYIMSALFAGLAAFTKSTGFFLIPALIYMIIYDNWVQLKKEKSRQQRQKIIHSALRKIGIFFILLCVISMPFLIKNFISFGNPAYPMLQNFFSSTQKQGISELAKTTPSISYFFDAQKVTKTLSVLYLELFGVPNGDIDTLRKININNIKPLLVVWIISTIIFISPAILGLKKLFMKNSDYPPRVKNTIFLLISSFLAVLVLTFYNFGETLLRFFIPAMISIAIIWAIGIDSILSRASNARSKKDETRSTPYNKIHRIAIILLILFSISFISTEFVKANISRSLWKPYQADFSWIKANTQKNSTFFYKGQCFTYNAERKITTQLTSNFDYVWVNDEFTPEYLETVMTADEKKQIQDMIHRRVLMPVYANTATETYVYKKVQIPANHSIEVIIQ